MASSQNSEEGCSRLRVEGWLNVWEGDVSVFSDGRTALALWEPHYCVLCCVERIFIHRTSERGFGEPGCSYKRLRLDGTKNEFDRRWGYETLESIKENVLQHSPQSNDGDLESSDSCESYTKTQSLDKHITADTLHLYKDSAYEKSSTDGLSGLGDRRGSVPVVSSVGLDHNDHMDTTATPSRFANFFSRKVKSNLKRTKSVTKLERRKLSVPAGVSGGSSGGPVTTPGDGTAAADVEGSPKFSLKRTMSLGRLSKKSGRKLASLKPHGGSSRDINKPKNEHNHSEIGNVINTRMRASRSHESLLTSPSSLHSIDLSGPDIEIKPLHSSMLGQDHCFQVTTSTGSKYYSCRSAEERQKWIQHLRKTVEPNQEQTRRKDHSIKLWVQEAKNLASKKRYFCELCLDRTIYARTSSKTKGELLFWGEQFDFTNLPPVEVITINVYREPDKKRKKEKNTLIGYVNIPVTEVSSRTLVEKWYTCSSATVGKSGKDGKGDLPIIRVKSRYQTVDILPMDMYDQLLDYVERDYSVLVEVLEPLISVKSKEEIASCLVSIFQKRGKVKDLLSDIVMTEVNKKEKSTDCDSA